MKVLVVDDHPIVAFGYRQIFADRTDVVLNIAKTIAEARFLIKADCPDVTIINSHLPDGCGSEFVQKLTKQKSKLHFLIFSMTDEPSQAMRAIDCGAKGFISKNAKAADIIAAVEAVAQGKTWIADTLVQQIAFARVVRQTYQPRLTRREKNVLHLLVNGCSSSQIATELNISSTLVSTDCAAMRRKLNARTTAEMVAIAVKSDLGK